MNNRDRERAATPETEKESFTILDFLNRKKIMELWDRLMFPLRSVWISIAIRLGIRNKGLSKLKHDVRRCEYEDVHVMWEMLRKTESENPFGSTTAGFNNSSPTSSRGMNKHNQKRPILKMFVWARRAPYLCSSF